MHNRTLLLVLSLIIVLILVSFSLYQLQVPFPPEVMADKGLRGLLESWIVFLVIFLALINGPLLVSFSSNRAFSKPSSFRFVKNVAAAC